MSGSAETGLTDNRGTEEVTMSPNWNEPTYRQQFAGNLRGSSEPVPICVNTNLRMMPEDTMRDFKNHDTRTNRVPIYVFDGRVDLPLHPHLQAVGRHYFTW